LKPIVKDPNTLQSRGIESSVKFGIKASGLHHILGILRNQLYSDKILAVLREYTTNAVDAHIMAGCPERPVEVSLPTKLNLLFKVRDYGPALSDEEIQDVYAFYGESTKRTSNDVTGMLGIGSKSAFAYGDNFVINSYLDGKKHIHNAFIDPSQVGQISKIGVEDTEEENGIEIVVPVRDDDVEEFASKAKDLFKHFKVRPIVKGVAEFDYEDKNILFSGETWEWREASADRWNRNNWATVVMGNIGYPVHDGDLNLNYDDKLSNLVTENLILKVPIGDVEISASREKLQFTDHTRKKLKEHLSKVREELVEIISKEFGECKTLYEAMCLYGSTFTTDSPLYQLRDVLKKHLTWNGKPVDGNDIRCYNSKGTDLRSIKITGRSKKYRPSEESTIWCDKNTILIENDLGHRRGLMGKMLPLVITQGKKPHILQWEDTYDGSTKTSATKNKKAWIKETRFDGKLIKLSSLPSQKLSDFDGYGSSGRSSGGSNYSVDKKHSATCFEFDWDYDGGRWHNKKSDFWKIASLDVEEDSGLYVIIDKFEAENVKAGEYARHQNPREIRSLKDDLKQAGIDMPERLYAFKVKDRSKIEGKDGWTNLYDWVAEKLESVIKDDKLDQAWIDIQHLDNLTQNNNHIGSYGSETAFRNLEEIYESIAVKDGVFGSFMQKYLHMRHTKEIRVKIKAVNELSKSYNVDFKSPNGVQPAFDLPKAFNEVFSKYSMLNLVKEWNDWRWKENNSTETITNYINVIDLCNNAREAQSQKETHGL